MNDGILSKEDLKNIKGEKYLKGDSKELERLKFESNKLLGEIERVSKQLEEVNILFQV